MNLSIRRTSDSLTIHYSLFILHSFRCALKTEHCSLCVLTIWQPLSLRFGQAFGLLVSVSLIPLSTYTPDLSTSSSTTCLSGDLILGGVSRLDAFSVYLVRT